jgi:S-formylglutathione hydrolase FrmB
VTWTSKVAIIAAVVVAAGVAAAWAALRESSGFATRGARIESIAIHSKFVHRDLEQLLVIPKSGGKGRMLLVLLHGRGGSPASFLSDQFFAGIHALGKRAPDILLAAGGDHSYYHNRRDGKWGTYIVREAIPAALYYSHADPHRVAIGGVSMGGFGALDLGRLRPHRFCAVGGHSAALWFHGGETPSGAFDDAANFARHDLIRFARHWHLYRVPVWMDDGASDPFLSADTTLASLLRRHGTYVRFHRWAGGHDYRYWNAHMRAYLRFYARACA